MITGLSTSAERADTYADKVMGTWPTLGDETSDDLRAVFFESDTLKVAREARETTIHP